MFQESGYPNLKKVAQVGFLSLASFGSAGCFGSPSDFDKQLARERIQEASGQLSTTQSIRHHPINRFIVGLGDKELYAVDKLRNWWKEYSTEVLSIPGNLSDADRRLILEWYLTTPWIEEGTPALYTESFMSQALSLVPELTSSSVANVRLFKAGSAENERYRQSVADFGSTATKSMSLRELGFGANMYTIRMYDSQGQFKDRRLLALSHINTVEQAWLLVKSCQEYSCATNIAHAQDIVNEIQRRGTMYYGNTPGGQERARKIEEMQKGRMKKVASLLINGNVTAEKARGVQDADSQIQVAPLDNRNITRKENPSEDVGRGGTGGSNVSGGNIVSDCGKIDNINYDYAPAQRASGKNVCKAPNGQFFIKIPRKN